LKQDENNIDSLLHMARFYRKVKEYELSYTLYTKVLEKEP